jgi:DNA-binding transcriptional regulator YhcF (GntR family)
MASSATTRCRQLVILRIDATSPRPPYEQIREQVTALVQAGVLEPGYRLPSIRQLANDLQIAGGTVARAYRELEARGIVRSRGRHGTSVVAPTSIEAARAPELWRAAGRFAREVHRRGVREEDAISAIRAAFAAAGWTP